MKFLNHFLLIFILIYFVVVVVAITVVVNFAYFLFIRVFESHLPHCQIFDYFHELCCLLNTAALPSKQQQQRQRGCDCNGGSFAVAV